MHYLKLRIIYSLPAKWKNNLLRLDLFKILCPSIFMIRYDHDARVEAKCYAHALHMFNTIHITNLSVMVNPTVVAMTIQKHISPHKRSSK